MAIKNTPYLQAPYTEGGDKDFRSSYNGAMDKIDAIFHSADSIKYPAVPQSTFDASFFAPNTAKFELRPEMSRFLQLGNTVFFEVALNSKIAFSVPPDGNVVDQIVGTITPKFKRARGSYITAINGIAASYGMSTNSAGSIEIRLANFGGMSLQKTVPKGTYFGIAGRFMTTN